MTRRRASVLLTILLVVFPLAALAETVSQQDIRLYYNREGGHHYHTTPKCESIHPTYYPYIASFPLRELGSYQNLTPCATCEADFQQALWFGEAEARAAAESLGETQIIAWKITPDKDRICLLLSDDSGSLREIDLEFTGGSWIRRAADN